VDSSVWIRYFRPVRPVNLEKAIDFADAVTCLPVLQEVLQGFSDEDRFRAVRQRMAFLPLLENPMSESLYQEAVNLYRLARRSGFTPRSGVDCLIAACAIRQSIPVLHWDRDFDSLAKISPLKVERL
jgi:hypothetical protein